MDEQQLAYIEAWHYTDEQGEQARCEGCQRESKWPCHAVELAAEVRRLQHQRQQEIAAAQPVPADEETP